MRKHIFAQHACQTLGVSNKTTTIMNFQQKKNSRAVYMTQTPSLIPKNVYQMSLKAYRNCGRQTQRKTKSTRGWICRVRASLRERKCVVHFVWAVL